MFSCLFSVQSLIKSLLKMKDWSAVLGDDTADDGNLDLDMKSGLEDTASLGVATGFLLPLHRACVLCSCTLVLVHGAQLPEKLSALTIACS